MFDISWSDFTGTLIPFVIVSYLVIVGFVMMILGSVQEASRMREELETRWPVRSWSSFRLVGASLILALPSLLILIPIGLIFVV